MKLSVTEPNGRVSRKKRQYNYQEWDKEDKQSEKLVGIFDYKIIMSLHNLIAEI